MAKTKTEKKEKPKKKENYLVIVESPAKSKTIKKILGDNYEIKASFGHIRDFPKKVLGVDVTKDFEPIYEIIAEKKKVVDELNKLAKKADKVYLAPDPDREGEAIAWHIASVLDKPSKDVVRIEFNEITKNAILNSLENPREIDINRVKAQQTRQILDRLVGYKISPILWQKMKNNRLSAGRVQSVAVKIICEREAEIEAFQSQEYWTISADLAKPKSSVPFTAELAKYKNEKIDIKNEKEAQDIVKSIEKAEFKVSKIGTKSTKRNPQAPFITSTLQREASTRLGYSVKKTMQIAQKLYEGIELASGELVGLITYMRTDSTRISDEATAAAKDYIIDHYGKKYYPEEPKVYAKKGKNVQDAHEAIRPTYIDKSPESVKSYLTSEQYRLYKLIWSRFMASQMESADVKTSSVEIEANEALFKASTSKITFDGFLIVYNDKEEDEEEKEKSIPDLEKGDVLNLKKIDPKQHFTQPPPRYSEATLVKTLEELGIGRPSTYAPIISKIQERGYIIKDGKALMPAMLGKAVNEQLGKHFSEIVNYNFTANMETKLDDIAEHKAESKKILKEFYEPFSETINKAKDEMEKVDVLSGELCPNCGKPLAIKTSRWNTQFLGCTGYPECKTSLPLTKDQKAAPEDRPSDEVCEKCNSPMVIRYGPYGDYLACSNADCKNKKRLEKKTGVKCPNEGCDGEIVQKKSRYGKIFYGCNKYPSCNFAIWNKPTGEKCPECSSLLVYKFLKRGNKIACSSKECKYSIDYDGEEQND